ncbi:hypothetical protein TSUD_93990 [Trifolium subterraneum]|uniref:Uncharacterized protein n=1 Tax=Trifolium subterraneum TaxID=3900 RepID=A0A2Z6N941_TRISU|nr:hypothetical protein TSUD_93990 [Trifolium subterraneum]
MSSNPVINGNPVTNGSIVVATIDNNGIGGSNLRQNRNTTGMKTDIAWNHGVAIDETRRKIKCKYCGKIVLGADKIFNMMDEVVDETGEENVVQVVTDNVAKYKAAGELLMQKWKHLYWTPCAAHCIELMMDYTFLWEIIDKRWDKQLHRLLHATGYYLNHVMHYSPTFKADFEVKEGMYECLKMMVGNKDERIKIDAQLEEFKSKARMFGGELATCVLKTKTPAQWWESYGDTCPELQMFAIRILSLTCTSSDYFDLDTLIEVGEDANVGIGVALRDDLEIPNDNDI